MAAGTDKDDGENQISDNEYDNIEAALILDEARVAVKKTLKNKKKNVKSTKVKKV